MTNIADLVRARGQQIWFDHMSREMLDSGELIRRRDECGVGGITANPTMYAHSLAAGEAYVQAIGRRAEQARTDPETVFWDLAVEDAQRAADLLRGRFDETRGQDGLVSLELSPLIADDAEATVEAGLRLFARLDRPNVMVKVPATRAGTIAIEELTALRVNVNVTLIFGPSQWEDVWEAYTRGSGRAADDGGHPTAISVASLFLSRIDAAVVDRLPTELQGRVALATARLVYDAWERRLREDRRWPGLLALGAARQRLLWASVSTKDPSRPLTHYAERLVAPGTVITMSSDTLDAFCALDGTRLSSLNGEPVDSARAVAAAMIEHGLTIDSVAEELQEEGLGAFEASFAELLATIRNTADERDAMGSPDGGRQAGTTLRT